MLLNRFDRVFREEHGEDGKDLGGNKEIEGTLDKDAQKIIDEANGVIPIIDDEEEEKNKLPSDKESGGDKLFAEKYKTVDDLKAGITELKSTLPQYVIDGMSEDALEQHYVELRKEFSGKKEESKDKKYVKEEKKEEDNKKEEEAKEAIPAKLWSELETSFNDTGAITTEMYDSLEKAGIPNAIVDNYLDGLNTQKISFTNSVMEIAGGQEQYDDIKAWAEDGNVDDALLESMQTMNYAQIIPIYKGIKAQYDASVGQSSNIGKRITGSQNISHGAGYASQTDYLADVADKRYGQNRAYTEKVQDKLKASKFS